MRDTILYDSAFRLFGDHVSPKLLAAAEAGTWPAELWAEVERAGYLDVLADGLSGMVEAAIILRAAGPIAGDDAGALALRRGRDRAARGAADHCPGRAGGHVRLRPVGARDGG